MDGGYIVTGRTASFGNGGEDVWLIKTDSLGQEEWDQTYGGSQYEGGYSILQTSDDGFIISGCTSSFGNGNYDAWLIKTDSLGNEEWDQTYGGANWESVFSLQITSDNGYIIIGGTNSFGNGGDDVWLIKTDSVGAEEWNQTYGGIDWETGFSGIETLDHGYIISGGTTSFGAGDRDLWLIKVDSLGNEEWDQTCGGVLYDVGSSIIQTTEGEYIIAGSTLSFGSGGWDGWLIGFTQNSQSSSLTYLNENPMDFVLCQNFPNPFNPGTTLRYYLPEQIDVIIDIYDINGRKVINLLRSRKSAGWHEIRWEGSTDSKYPLETGIYYAKIKAGRLEDVVKMLYTK